MEDKKNPITKHTYYNEASYRRSTDIPQYNDYLGKMVDNLRPHAQVLDIGSGAGIEAKYLRTRGCMVIEIDVSHEALGVGQTLDSQNRISSQVDFNVGGLPFPKNIFDAIHTKDAITHIIDLEKFFKETHRILKPGGILFLSNMPKTSNSCTCLDTIQKRQETIEFFDRKGFLVFQKDKNRKPIIGVSLDVIPVAIEELAQKVGYKVSSIKGVPFVTRLPNNWVSRKEGFETYVQILKKN